MKRIIDVLLAGCVAAILLSLGSMVQASFGVGIRPGTGGGISAGDQAKLDLFTINGSNLELDSGYSFVVDSSRKIIASIIQANTGSSLDLREDGGSSSFTIGTDGVATSSMSLAIAHGEDLLIGTTGEGLRANDSSGVGTWLFLTNGAQESNNQIASTSLRIQDVRAAAMYDKTGAGPPIFYSGAKVYRLVFVEAADPGTPATNEGHVFLDSTSGALEYDSDTTDNISSGFPAGP